MPKVDARIAKDTDKSSGAGDIYTYEDKIFMLVRDEEYDYFYLINIESGIELDHQGESPGDLLSQVALECGCNVSEFIKAPKGSKITLTV